MKSTHIVIGFVLLAFVSIGFTANEGTTSLEFLSLQPDARSAVFRSAFVSVADDVNASAINPSGLILQKKMEASISHALWVSGISLEHVAFGLNMKKAGTLALNATYLNSSELTFLTAAGEQNLSTGSLSAGFSYGVMVIKNLMALGASAKFVTETIDSSSSVGFSSDAGILVAPAKGFQIGLSVKNLGVSGTVSGLPMEFIGGLSYKYRWKEILLESLQLAIATKIPLYANIGFGGAVEASLKPSKSIGVKLRTGLEYPDAAGSGLMNMLAFGAGITYSKIGFDWSMLSLGDLGYAHRMSLSWKM
jgi:hypothetical protein